MKSIRKREEGGKKPPDVKVRNSVVFSDLVEVAPDPNSDAHAALAPTQGTSTSDTNTHNVSPRRPKTARSKVPQQVSPRRDHSKTVREQHSMRPTGDAAANFTMPTIRVTDADDDLENMYGSDYDEVMQEHWREAQHQRDHYHRQQQRNIQQEEYRPAAAQKQRGIPRRQQPRSAWREDQRAEEEGREDEYKAEKDWNEPERRSEDAYKTEDEWKEEERRKKRESLSEDRQQGEQRKQKKQKRRRRQHKKDSRNSRKDENDNEDTKEKGDYVVSGPQGTDLYNDRQVSLPPLSHAPAPSDVMQPSQHGIVESQQGAQVIFVHDTCSRQPKPQHDRWRARKVRFFRNGDRYYPGYEFVFKPGRDVVNMEALCDKISDRIGLINGARYIFGLDGRRRYRIEELEDGESYVAASDRKFVTLPYGLLAKPRKWTALTNGAAHPSPNLAYGRQRPDWNQNSVAGTGNAGDHGRVESPVVREVSKKNSAESNKSGNSKPGSREGRTIKIINNLDHSQERTVLVNMKTINLWEEVVKDLGRMFKLNGQLHLFTTWGQEVKSFSQFKNDFANVDTFYVSLNNAGVPARAAPTGASGGPGAGGEATSGRRRSLSGDDDKKNGKVDRRPGRTGVRRHQLRRYTSEPTLKETPEESDAVEEMTDGRAAVVVIKGQRRVLHAPKNPVMYMPAPPRARLTLDWVYGYRGSDTRRNLWVLPSGELLYYVAAVAVILDRTDDVQRHYTEHTEDIQCMALHPSRELVASGQRASRGQRTTAHVRVWHARTLTTLHVLGKKDLGAGILAVAFSSRNNGEFLLAVDADKEHLLSVWTWTNEKVFGKVATHQDHVWGAAFHPLDNNLIITYGRGLLSLWARRKDGIFTRSDLVQEGSGKTVTALEFTPGGDLITGDQEGLLTVWSIDADGDYYIKKEFQAHSSAINSLQLLSEGTVLSGGDKDRRIIAWDCEEDFEKITETKLPDQAGGIRSLYPQRPGHNDGNIYVGTTKNMVLEGSLQRRFNQVVFGHSKQLWGLAVNHMDGSVATAGYDKHIIKWRDNQLEWRIQAQSECVSVAVHPQGSRIAAGTIDGHLVVLNGHTGHHVTTLRVCGSPLSCLAYNPGGELLAVGCQNGSIYLYRSTKDGFVYTRCGKMTGTQPLSCIDWSTSGRYLQSLTSDYDIVYWSLVDLARLKNSLDVRNETWATHTCPLGFMVHGIWSGRKDAPIQVSVDRGPRGDILAAGDTDGYIRLYRYPVLSLTAGYHEYKVYTSYVSSVRFSHTDNYLYSIGDTDAALMRWRIT
ncbi:LOW QUALITY PROTEIN: echinoderm microtubule-associated protein-like CG42247 [Panulirus ornatus]|uniref:LOW QUALITY PROTEIN: echinoderm microtubule-associated protein-like CG42247 n=1 Tax=Panulirus ornatus TaxID=150431 RepID=UPI003A8BEC5B